MAKKQTPALLPIAHIVTNFFFSTSLICFNYSSKACTILHANGLATTNKLPLLYFFSLIIA